MSLPDESVSEELGHFFVDDLCYHLANLHLPSSLRRPTYTSLLSPANLRTSLSCSPPIQNPSFSSLHPSPLIAAIEAAQQQAPPPFRLNPPEEIVVGLGVAMIGLEIKELFDETHALDRFEQDCRLKAQEEDKRKCCTHRGDTTKIN
ncbi:uncharacterized protein LOC131012742 [Salvia miltiorrhiza]|uniref:uncharacterized protein LOC131012742 n=1 Tax=Salvia miltiorrhiza TaxID=226208 RepID=UPI0025AC7066|nr:uncharacterized protein LOC131012742 [Salvia miltiorrhiza]